MGIKIKNDDGTVAASVTISELDGEVNVVAGGARLGWLLDPFGNRTGWVAEDRFYRITGHATRRDALRRLWDSRPHQ